MTEELKQEDLRIESWPPQGTTYVSIPLRGVRITHIPTGLQAFCDTERGQYRNKAIAMDKLTKMLANDRKEGE